MNKRKQQILDDLSTNFKVKIKQAFKDFCELCDAAEIDDRDILSTMAAIFMEATAYQIATITSMPPEIAANTFAVLIDAYRERDATMQKAKESGHD